MSRLLSLTTVAVLAGGVLPAIVSTPALAAPPATVVTGGDVSVDGSSGWAIETTNGATGAFVSGTGTPPLGTGSFFMQSNAVGDKKFLHMTKVDGVLLRGRPLTDLTDLSYSTFAANGVYSPYVNIPIHSDLIDANNNGLADGTEVGVPSATGNAIMVYETSAPNSTWSTSTPLAPSATWRVTRPIISGGTIPIWTYQTWAQWTGILTDGVFNPVYGDIQWVIGDSSSVSWSGKSGWVDAIGVTTTTEDAVYDLEEGLGSCPVAIDNVNKALTLTGDCTTSVTLTLHNGWALDGAGYTITAVDPSPSIDFTGPVLTNEIVPGGASMDVTDVAIDGNLDSGCSSSLFGVKFDGARGSFTHSTVSDIKYGTGSGCQSGNSVDITNLGGPTRLPVTVDDVHVTGFQKTGIRANGNVALRLTDSTVASSELDLVTASNSLQLSRGARAYVSGNSFGGNDWDGNSSWSATGVLLYGAEDVTFTRNVVTGTDTDFGLYVSQDATYQAGRTTLTCNLFERDSAIDTPLDLWNTGVAADEDLIAKVSATGNTVRGFATSYENVVNETGGPCPSGPVANLVVGGDATSLTATWTLPTPVDAAPVTSYRVTLTPGGATQTVNDLTATFGGLTPAKEYSVNVVPMNAAGQGTPASASGATGPGAATITSTSTTDTSATLDWTVPGSAYTSFDVVVEDTAGIVDTHSAAGDSRTWTFSGLDPETDYTLTVTPRIGPESGVPDSADVTTAPDAGPPPSAPGPVTALSLDGAGTMLTATWTAASGATDYEATLLPGGQVQSVTGTTANFTVVPGKEFTVTVVAHSTGGYGPGRSASLDTALPAAPTSFSAKGGPTFARLTWNPPTPPSPVTDYTVVATPTTGPLVTQSVPGAGLTFPVTVNGLVENTTYTFSVTANNVFGAGTDVSKKLRGVVTRVRISPTKVKFGQKITATGKVTDADSGKPVSGQKLYLFGKTKGSTAYTSLGAKATSGANGKYSFKYQPKASQRLYVSSRGPDRMGADSTSTTVVAKATATMKPNRTSVKSGAVITFTGRARPKSGASVALQRKQASGWVTTKTTAPTGDGSYTVKWQVTSKKDYPWRVRVSGPAFASGVSPATVVTVT